MAYIEKKSELKRKRQRRSKIRKLRQRMERAKTPGEAQTMLSRIKRLNPFWEQPAKAK